MKEVMGELVVLYVESHLHNPANHPDFQGSVHESERLPALSNSSQSMHQNV